MTPKFIILSARNNKNRYYINIEHITYVLPYYDGVGSSIGLLSGTLFEVKESQTEIMELIDKLF